MRISRDFDLEGSAVLFSFVLIIVCLAAWLTHVISCIGQELWIFLIAGAIAFPLGIIHGIGIWFGAF